MFETVLLWIQSTMNATTITLKNKIYKKAIKN